MNTLFQIPSLLAATLAAAVVHPAWGQALPAIQLQPNGPACVAGEVLVQFKAGVTDAQVTEAFRRGGLALKRLLRDCLTKRQAGTTANHWRSTGDVPSRLGAALLTVALTAPVLNNAARQAKFAEAERLLLDGYECLEHYELSGDGESIPVKYKRDAITRLVHLYQAWRKPGEMVKWEQKLDEMVNVIADK